MPGITGPGCLENGPVRVYTGSENDGRRRQNMTKILTVEGMMCGMCEAHVNEALRKVPGVKKASW